MLKYLVHHFPKGVTVYVYTHSACRHVAITYWQLLLPIYTIYQHWTLKATNLNSIKEMVCSIADFKASDSYAHIKLKAFVES